MKNLLIATRVFALVTLLFIPSFAIMLLVGFVVGEARWFAFAGLPALLVNAILVVMKPQRDWIWQWVNTIAGTEARR